MVRSSKQDVLSDREFVQLLEGARNLKGSFSIEARFVIMTAGLMGMRIGEIIHIDESWINSHRRMIEVPEYHDCCGGTNDGEVCGYCRNRANDYVESHNREPEELKSQIRTNYRRNLDEDVLEEMAIEKSKEDSVTFDEALDERWTPKTDNAVRKIPYDFKPRLHLCIDDFIEEFGGWKKSIATAHRRINQAVDESVLDCNVYPHALRATAVSKMASKDVSPFALMSLMGWEDLDTARSYIQSSDESAAKELREKLR